MTSFFTTIIHNLVCWIETAGVFIANKCIFALGAFIQGLLAALPSFPSLPSMPSQIASSLQFGEYWFPLDWFFGELATFVTFALVWFLFSIALRWGKAIRGNQ